ncbi:MAG: cytochrome c oxidase subunit 3 [Candidatus Hydrogenedentes bacterium]|nr:cytochrome c oxidase subunit 3 [Candidatus Hydrogenedentota bacterium]
MSSSPHAEPAFVAHHFHSAEQQKEAATLGMWLFLAQEVMFFGGLFCVYAVYRLMNPDAWLAGSTSLSVLAGGVNTTVLLCSSFSMALGVYYAQLGDNRRLFNALAATLALGLLFIATKLQFEYLPKYQEGVFPGANWGPHGGHYGHLAEVSNQSGLEMFFVLYYIMTGMHALHMAIGFGIMVVLMVLARKNAFGPRRFTAIENFGLYWHFVDIVWVFLFPMFYLVR